MPLLAYMRYQRVHPAYQFHWRAQPADKETRPDTSSSGADWGQPDTRQELALRCSRTQEMDALHLAATFVMLHSDRPVLWH